jgi:hypothetical protein
MSALWKQHLRGDNLFSNLCSSNVNSCREVGTSTIVEASYTSYKGGCYEFY